MRRTLRPQILKRYDDAPYESIEHYSWWTDRALLSGRPVYEADNVVVGYATT